MFENYQVLRIQLNGQDMYILWYSNTRDGIYVNETTGVIPIFGNMQMLMDFCSDNRINIISDEIIFCNLDLIRGWLEKPTEHGIKYDDFFHVWNIIHDVAWSIEDLDELEELYSNYYILYDKLFWGAMMESRETHQSRYYQDWNEEELESLQGIFEKGMNYFRYHSEMVTGN